MHGSERLIHVTQDKLDHALQQRPKLEELVKEGILKGANVPIFSVSHSNVDLTSVRG